jgi:Zn-dependent protease with chaperone function
MMSSFVIPQVGAPDRWPSERPLFITTVVFACLLWVAIVVTIIGLVYAVLFALLLLFVRLVLVSHLRGNGVRLGSDQFPELYDSVVKFSRQFGLETTPDAYLLQNGGVLNAFAMKFTGTNFVVLNSALVDACGDNSAARDMIIGHELGHIHAGHLRYQGLLAPAMIVPFLGKALSRAREYTCDRYGLAAAGNLDGALTGLAILAAGAKHGPRVNRQALSRQQEEMNTGWMTLAQWLSTHPPLTRRIAALDPALNSPRAGAGPLRAAAVVAGIVVVAIVIPQGLKRVQQTPASDVIAKAQANQPGTPAADEDGGPLERAMKFFRPTADRLPSSGR